MENRTGLMASTISRIVNEIVSLRVNETMYNNIMAINGGLWKYYAEYIFKIKACYEHSIISENMYLSDVDLQNFYIEMVSIIDLSVKNAIDQRYISHIEPIIKMKEERAERIKSIDLPEKERAEEIQRIIKGGIKEEKKALDKGIESIEEQSYSHACFFINRFWEMFKKCDSPLEQAFVIGVFSYRFPEIIWFDENSFNNQYQQGKYRLDFVFRVNDIKVNVELDGHNFHEKTKEQAVSDRSRDRDLQKKGWHVLRFHSNEVQMDLKSCVKQVMDFLKLKRMHLVKGS